MAEMTATLRAWYEATLSQLARPFTAGALLSYPFCAQSWDQDGDAAHASLSQCAALWRMQVPHALPLQD